MTTKEAENYTGSEDFDEEFAEADDLFEGLSSTTD
jgi:hypothetical protein